MAQHIDAKSRQTLKLKRRMSALKNEMDLVEILCNFWPLPNMKAKHKRLKAELEDINTQLYANTLLKTDPNASPYTPVVVPPVSYITRQITPPTPEASPQPTLAERIDANLFNPFQRKALVHAI